MAPIVELEFPGKPKLVVINGVGGRVKNITLDIKHDIKVENQGGTAGNTNVKLHIQETGQVNLLRQFEGASITTLAADNNGEVKGDIFIPHPGKTYTLQTIELAKSI